MRKQLFGFTPSGPTEAGELVKYVQVFAEEGGLVLVTRNSKGEHTEVPVPRNAAEELGLALIRNSAAE